MKASLLPVLTISLVTVLLSACDKGPGIIPEISSKPLTGVGTGGGGTGGGGTGSGGGTTTPPPAERNAYQPLSTGTTWRYVETSGTDKDTTQLTVTGNTKVINSKTFYEIAESSRLGKDTSYYNVDGHDYTNNTQNFAEGIGTDILYLNDEKPVGYTWTGQAIPANPLATGTYSGKITEIGITKTVLGKTYTNVIHTQVNLSISVFGGTPETLNCDFYIAKGIGLIQFDTNDGTDTSSNQLIDYTIK